ncbi:MAG: flagellar hook basal-body protein [Pseudomonadota bacterium]
MSEAFDVGTTGLVALQRALDTLANNVTNLNTDNFKRSEVSFSQVVADVSDFGNRSSMSTAGVRAADKVMLGEQGELRATENSLDLAVDGSGFIELVGPRGEVYLWRGGSLAVDADGSLVGQSGMLLRDSISVPSDASEIEIRPDGLVFAHGTSDGSLELGQIHLVNVENIDELEQQTGGVLRLKPGIRSIAGRPGEDGFGLLAQGARERSNVNLNTEMIEMMIVQRAYAANAQIIQAADQLMSITTSLRR